MNEKLEKLLQETKKKSEASFKDMKGKLEEERLKELRGVEK